MKFFDIDKLTRVSNYAIDVPISYMMPTLQHYIDDMDLDMNPDFQRGHVWTEEQQVAFVEYLLRGGMSGKDIYFNAPFWNRSVTDGKYNSFVLVDGLQRLTAALKFVNNKLRVFRDLDKTNHIGYLFSDFEGRPSLDFCFKFHVNDLQTRAEVLKWYLEMNSGGTPHSQEELNRVSKLYADELNK